MKFATTLFLASLAVAAADFVPVVEDNWDFVGNDVANVKADSVDKCTDLCKANTQCKAYTWSNYQGGTCWLKSKRGAVKFSPGLKSAVLLPLVLEPCRLLDDVDFVGADITSVPGDNMHSCCDKCLKLDKCRVYSWNNYQGGTCWLKSDMGTPIYRRGVESGVAYPYEKPNVFFPNTDYVGHDIGNAKAAKFELCVDICANFAGCRAFTWNNYQGGTCWLKAAKGNEIAKDGVTAAVGTKPVAVPKASKDDIDFFDNDFQNVAGIVEPTDCVQICADTPNCGAVVWNDYRNGTCWLKHGAGNEIPKPGVKAFVL